MSVADDLSGHWHGIYNYPERSGIPSAVAFTADLTDSTGRLGGTITEDDIITDGRTLVAGIDGQHIGTSVEFTKFYEDADPESYDAVAYRGTVSPDGAEISGRWDIPGAWSGTFIMTRSTADAVEATAATDEVVR